MDLTTFNNFDEQTGSQIEKLQGGIISTEIDEIHRYYLIAQDCANRQIYGIQVAPEICGVLTQGYDNLADFIRGELLTYRTVAPEDTERELAQVHFFSNEVVTQRGSFCFSPKFDEETGIKNGELVEVPRTRPTWSKES